MANVLFTRAPLSEIEDVQTTQYPVTDGQLLFDTSGSGKMYMDVGTSRLEMGGAMTIDSKLNSTSTNPIQNKAVGGVMLSTLDEINAATSKGFITDALATRALAQKIGTTDISSIGDGTCTGAISSLNANIADTHTITGTDCSIHYTEVNATLVIIKSGANLTGGNTFNQAIVTLPDGVKIQNEALLGKPAPVLDGSWVPTGDYVSLGTSDEKNITGRTLNNHTDCVVIFSTTFPRQYLQLS